MNTSLVCLNCGFILQLSQPRQWGDLGFWSRGWFPLGVWNVITLSYWRSLWATLSQIVSNSFLSTWKSPSLRTGLPLIFLHTNSPADNSQLQFCKKKLLFSFWEIVFYVRKLIPFYVICVQHCVLLNKVVFFITDPPPPECPPKKTVIPFCP
jgi:hypothetical protein